MMTVKDPRSSSSIEIGAEIVTIAVVHESSSSADASDHSRVFRPAPWFPKRDVSFRQGLAVRADRHGLLPELGSDGVASGKDDLA
ncbi:hypothetical protein [Sphingomonas albertensis]|uniref:Uncharacterized protein n=1 Tax=Sphingomonas albertensis TaxID=2762591 RepID=A0ABR7ARB2_9SPHN|nr:hypothetical protein [Sphingomonas albertensis]MBC3942989.1 hypothetical protein [Sphingomonas albertensis]